MTTPLDKERLAYVKKLERVAEAARQLIAEPGDLEFPRKDVYGMREKEDVDAPLWCECGLYGRVGKYAARELLARHRKLDEALQSLNRGEA